ncbi:BRCT domain-containing protein [Aspergillus venezuelensis]
MPPERTITPRNHLLFDPWNTESSGHQRSDSNPGTSWRRTRGAKLAQQLRTGDSTINSFVYRGTKGGSAEKVYEKGEWEWDWGGDARGGRGGAGFEKKGRNGNGKGEEREDGQRDIRFMMRAGKDGNGAGVGAGEKRLDTEGKGKMGGSPLASTSVLTLTSTSTSTPPTSTSHTETGDTSSEPVSASIPDPTPSFERPSTQTPGAFNMDPTPNSTPSTSIQQSLPSAPLKPLHEESNILRNTTIYINGQTTPLISDHKLKSLLVSHGATLSLSLSRRITHVIIGKPNGGPGKGGAGGGLAAGKIQKEISRGGWRGIRVVGVEWVLESIKAGKRLPETRFAVNLLGQRSVLEFM